MRNYPARMPLRLIAALAALHLALGPGPEEWRPLLGEDALPAWHPATGWRIEGSVLTATPESEAMWTRDEFSNFILRFEFRLTPGANNGVGIRAPMGSNPAYEGMEIQVLDTDSPRYATIKPWQVHGSIYGVVPAKRGALRPVGEWNQQQITADGTHIEVRVNGTVIVDADLVEFSRNGTMDGNAHQGLLHRKGRIALLGHGDEVSFRAIEIRELP